MDIEKEIEELKRRDKQLEGRIRGISRRGRLDKAASVFGSVAKYLVPKGSIDGRLYLPKRRRRKL